MGKFHRTKVGSGTLSCSYCNKTIKPRSFAFQGGFFTSGWYCGGKCVKDSGNEIDKSLLGKLFW
jgi:hypothetical protein